LTVFVQTKQMLGGGSTCEDACRRILEDLSALTLALQEALEAKDQVVKRKVQTIGAINLAVNGMGAGEADTSPCSHAISPGGAQPPAS